MVVNKPKKKTESSRYTVLYIIMFIIMGTIIAKLLYLQVYKHDEYKEKADVSSTKFISEEAPRGNIYDSNGNVIGGIRFNQDDESKPVVQSAVPAESEGDTENIQSVEEQISEEQSPEKQEELTQEFVGAEENSEIQEEDSQAEGNKSEDGQESESTEENELN